MPNLDFLYTFNYDYHLDALCKLESRQIFDKEEKDKLLFSPFKIDPSISAFIKTRLEIIASSEARWKLGSMRRYFRKVR